jgi:two-component system cell cycle response regulator
MTKTVLVVDDSSAMRMTIREELEEHGFLVVEAKDGFQALVCATEEPIPDLITLDIEMPKMDGFETCKRLRQEPYVQFLQKGSNKLLPVIFITGNDNMEDRRKGFQCGAVDFITKPFSQGEIADTVKRILNPQESEQTISALVVDDSLTTRKIINEILTRDGIQVIEAGDGNEAFQIISGQPESIDIVISDLFMPVLDGTALVAKIRKELCLADLPVIILTALADQSGILEVFKAGASDYLIKPFSKEEFLARIYSHIERYKLSKRLKVIINNLKKAHEEIRKLSITDPLTGCYNRQYMNSQLLKDLKRSRRYQRPHSLVLCDIDHFKSINDTHGHQAGDHVLQEFVNVLQATIRKDIDWIARYGGEEFLIVMPETGFENAMIVAERFRQAVQKKEIKFRKKKLSISASFGVTGFNITTMDEHKLVEKMLALSDKCLYRAKQKGRNRTEGKKIIVGCNHH